MTLAVGHSFGNCPQYIQLRDFEFARDPKLPPKQLPEYLDAITDDVREWIRSSDTFFVGSYVDREGERQVDVSHRGGKPGFVRVSDDGVLTVPDFAGNFHFNTLGNFLINSRAGLMFVDFETGDILQMSGRAHVILESPEISAFQGAERLWTFQPEKIVVRRAASPLRWKLRDQAFSPNALMTGSWSEAAAALEAEALKTAWRDFKIDRIVDEADHIKSFYLQPADGKGRIRHKAGQHLPIRVRLPGASKDEIRTYTISSAPADDAYRISIKQQDKVSDYLHSLKVGDILSARGPSGSFHLSGDETRPAVLISAGIGVTPMISMARHIAFEGRRLRQTRPTWIIQLARSLAERSFKAEFAALVAESEGAIKHIPIHSQPAETETENDDFAWRGRFATEDLSRVLPFDDYDFYLCGPDGFMQDVYSGLRAKGVANARIHAEAFGPSTLKRDLERQERVDEPEPAKENVSVRFTASAKEARWAPEQGTLLDLAEARGLEPDFSCRTGACGSCAAKLLKGSVSYPDGKTATVDPSHVLLCSAVPADGSGPLEVEI